MKKVLSLFLALVLCLVLPVSALAEDIIDSGTCGDNLTWTLNRRGTLTISGKGKMEDYSNSISSPWTKYNNSRNQNNNGYYIIDVIIENGVESIGEAAFYGCSDMVHIDIPNSVVSIGNHAFYHCDHLESIDIPYSVTDIGHSILNSCLFLENVSIPNSITSISYAMFAYCRNKLTNITIPEGITSIENGAFRGCEALASVTIPKSVIEIKDFAFDYCRHLTDIYYNGSEQDWNSINIMSDNDSLLSATIHYNNTAPDMSASTLPVTPYTSTASTAISFTDVSADAYYAKAVEWAVKNGVTNGTSATTFSPNSAVTRAQAATFLWRAMGEPEPTSSINPFTDIFKSDYYYKSILWAVEQGITAGTGRTTFSPNDTCTRAHIITFLWRAEGEADKTGNGTWYDDAVNWAKKQEFLAGTAQPFVAEDNCPRADVVYYLWKVLE